MLESLQRKFANYHRTSPITNIKNRSVTFVRDLKYFPKVFSENNFWLIAPFKLKDMVDDFCKYYYPNAKVHYTNWPEFEFTIYHNSIYKDKYLIKNPIVGKNCMIHDTVVMNVDGLKLVHTPDGQKIQFIHSGYVSIGDNVYIGPHTVIHRGTMGKTRINDNCQIAALNNIGHNCDLGEGTVLAAGVILNGGVTTGKNCWFSSGSTIRHHINITDNVVVGMGSVVTKDITESGVYIGNPAKFLKSVKEGWNF